MFACFQVVREEQEFSVLYEWRPKGDSPHYTFHLRPAVLVHNLLPYPLDISNQVSACTYILHPLHTRCTVRTYIHTCCMYCTSGLGIEPSRKSPIIKCVTGSSSWYASHMHLLLNPSNVHVHHACYRYIHIHAYMYTCSSCANIMYTISTCVRHVLLMYSTCKYHVHLM